MTKVTTKKKPSNSRAATGSNKAKNSRGSNDDLGIIKPIKKPPPDRVRGQLQAAFNTKVVKLPDGDMAMLVMLPAAPNGPIRVDNHNLTIQQVATTLEALNSVLPFPQKRITQWVQKARGARQRGRHKRKHTQVSAGEYCC